MVQGKWETVTGTPMLLVTFRLGEKDATATATVASHVYLRRIKDSDASTGVTPVKKRKGGGV